MGVYKRIEEVPNHHRLRRYTNRYANRDVWTEFCEKQEYQQGSSPRFRETVDRAGRHWRAHMDTRGRHHALATPADIESWCADLLADKSPATSYNYWVRIRRFYDWLQWHVDHPHRYNPVLMAAADGESAGRIWTQKLQKWENARSQDQQSND
jgi:hypothetical protein